MGSGLLGWDLAWHWLWGRLIPLGRRSKAKANQPKTELTAGFRWAEWLCPGRRVLVGFEAVFLTLEAGAACWCRARLANWSQRHAHGAL